jgi:DNA-binding transcriptional LysR family regulator
MSILDDTSIFAAVIQNGGFSHAAKKLGLSNGLVSRRIAHLESELAVTLIKRTTRQFQLTPEGELLWQHAQRIQQELDAAITLIHSSAKKPKGTIRVSAPFYFGRQYLTPIIVKFLNNFSDIKIDLDLSNQRHDLIKEHLDLVIRGAGYINEESLTASNLRMKLLIKDDIGLYANATYLQKYGEPKSAEELSKHVIISYIGAKDFLEQEKWNYNYKNKENEITLTPKFKCNDIESGLIACLSGYGIGKFTKLGVKNALKEQQLFPVLQKYHWGQHNLYAIYSNQKSLPQRTRLLLDFIYAQVQSIEK